MVSDTLVAVFGTLAGSVITGVLSLYRGKMTEESQDQRHRAEFYLEKKVERLSELHELLSECHSQLLVYMPQTARNQVNRFSLKEIEDLNELIDKTALANMKAKPYLSPQKSLQIEFAILAFQDALAKPMRNAKEKAAEIDEDSELSTTTLHVEKDKFDRAPEDYYETVKEAREA